MKLNLSLRTKFTIVLLLSSLLSLLVAGIITKTILLHEFSDIVAHQSFQRFHTEITIYLETYGSWKKAQEKESFKAFENRRRHLLGSPMPMLLTSQLAPNAAPEFFPATTLQSPFRFALADLHGKILMGNSHLKEGTVAPKKLRSLGKPVLLKGKPVALALPDSQPNLNDLDLGFIRAMQQAFITAGFIAVLLALFLGLVIGSRVNGRLRRLTLAIKSMQAGNLHQRVEERSGDEIGILANAFNQMSSELAQMHDALHKSNLQIKTQAKQLKELSIRDELTGLFNRRHSDEEGARLFEKCIQNSTPLTVVMADIDFFKKINDDFSHAMGDEVLRQIAELLQDHAREGDILARYGGEEFVLILPETPLQTAVEFCEDLRVKIEEHAWDAIHPDLQVTISFGLCDDTSCGNFETQLDKADDKLHDAKLHGRNTVHFDGSSELNDSEVLSR
jgi:diguanylate cyclase (GGDEF)-like protein